MKQNDLVGKKFNRLLVVSQAETKKQRTFWNCICDCGNKITIWGCAIKGGGTKSCGCLRRERTIASRYNMGILIKQPNIVVG